MEDKNLDPCPKCGGKVHIEIEDVDYPCYEFVVCEKCHSSKTYHFGDAIKKWPEGKNNGKLF